MQIVFVLEVRVDAWLAAAGRIETPRPSACPSCGHGRVNFDGWYRRQTRRGLVWLHRVLCADERCPRRSHSLLPDVLVTGRVDLASVIGWALEAKAAGKGHRPISADLGVPASTVRGWLRRAGRSVAVRGGSHLGPAAGLTDTIWLWARPQEASYLSLETSETGEETAVGDDPATRVALARWAVIGEATDERLSPAERGRLVSELAARVHRDAKGRTWRVTTRQVRP